MTAQTIERQYARVRTRSRSTGWSNPFMFALLGYVL